MILAEIKDQGILIGLSEKNIEKLKEGHPILKDSPKGKLVILYGKTEFAILNELKKKGFISKETAKSYEGFLRDNETEDHP
jgi:hypothetical protein